MRFKIKIRNSGFTLIEIITVIVIIGIIGMFGSLFLINMIKNYQWTEDNAHIAQKAQVALTRIAVEMAYADKGTIAVSGNTITYNATYPVGTQETGNKFELNGSSLMYENDDDQYVLADHVDSFVVDVDNWDDGYFEVSLTVTGANEASREFKKTIALP